MILSPKKKRKRETPPPSNIIVVEIHCNKNFIYKNEFLNCSCLMGTSRVDCMSMNF